MSIQEILTHSIEFVIAAHFALSLITAMSRRRRVAPGQLSLFDTPVDADRLSQVQSEAEADTGEWVAEVQQPEPIAFTPNTDQWEPTAEDRALVDTFQQFIQQYWAFVPTDNVVPFSRLQKQKQQAIDWDTFTPYQLPQECQKSGIRWRNARPDGKHLHKSEMIQALQQVAAA